LDVYGDQLIARSLAVGESLTWHWSLEKTFGWYDLSIEVEADSSFKQRLAGHVETGKDSVTDPAIGAR